MNHTTKANFLTTFAALCIVASCNNFKSFLERDL